MRNLKRALSLALAFVMVMSLMIVGTSAKSYTDADKIDNQVAVEILGEIGVMIGNDDGSFAPDRDVTRAEMAVIITRILYGNNMNVDQFKNMNTFTDVPDWAEGFVNLCASLDIIAGRGNGIFDPDATVTSAEAALMLSRALGYFKNNAEFGNDWALAAMKRATQAGIIGGDMVLQANAGLDRDDVAQMTFNTLTKAVPVQYNEVLDVYYNENQGVIYALEFNYLQTLGYKNFSLVYKTNEQVEYGRPATVWGIGSYNVGGQTTASGIKKSDLTSEGGLLPNYVRMLDKDEIITVNNEPVYVYDNGTKAKDIYSDLGAAACNDVKGQKASEKYTWTTFVNGKEVKSDVPAKNDGNNYKFTEKGAVVEIYVDDNTRNVTVVEINYYLGQVYNVKDGTTTIRTLSKGGSILDDRTFATEEFAEDDYVVFTVDYNNDEDYYICEMMAPETMTGKVARVENDDNSKDTYIRLDSKDGDKIYYTADGHMVYDVNDSSKTHPTLNEEYVLYMTPAGYILGFELANEKVPQYLYVQDSDEHLGSWDASVILPDATEPEVDLKDTFKKGNKNVDIKWKNNGELQHANSSTNIDGLIWDYSVSSSDVYGLTYIPMEGEGQNDLYQVRYTATGNDYLLIQNGRAYVDFHGNSNNYIVDDSTIFVDTINGVSYTGYSEVPNIHATDAAYVVENGTIQIMFILDGDIYDANMIYFFLTSAKTESEYDKDGNGYWEFQDSYVNGEKQKLMVAYDALNGDGQKQHLEVGKLYRGTQSFDEDGVRYYTQVVEVANLNENLGGITGYASTVDFQAGNAFGLNDANRTKFTTNGDTTYVLVERNPSDVKAYKNALANKTAYTGSFDWTVNPGRLSDMKAELNYGNSNIYVTVAKATNDKVAELVYIYHIAHNYTGDQFDVQVNGSHIDVKFDNVNLGQSVKSYNKGDDAVVTVAPQAGWQITNVTIAEGTAAVTNNGNGTYTVKVNDIDADVTINVDAITAQGNVYIIGDDITVTYQGEKPTVEEAIMAIEAKLAGLYTNERSITWSNVDNDYTFTVVTERGVSIEYSWDAHNDFIAGVNVEINGANVIVAKDADLTEAFAVANDAIEGYIVKDETTAVAADAAVVADASYTDKNIKAGSFYGQADEKVDSAMLTGLVGSQIKVGNEYIARNELTYGDLEKDGGAYDAKVPTQAAWLIMVDGKAQYVADGAAVNFTDAKSNFVLVKSTDKIIGTSSNPTATKDETYTTGYQLVTITATDIDNIDGAKVEWTNENGEALKKSDGGRQFILGGEKLVATVTLHSGLNAVSGDYIEIADAEVEIDGISATSYTEADGKVTFKEANINEGATLTFTTAPVTATLNVTLTINH